MAGISGAASLPFSRLLVVPSHCLAGDIPSFEEAIFVAWYGVDSRDGMASQDFAADLEQFLMPSG